MKRRILSALLALGAMAAFPASAQTVHPTPIDYRVVGSNPEIVQKFNADIVKLIGKNSGYEIRRMAPDSKLFVYVNQDVNDGINNQGVSIAVAHVSNLEAFYIASKIIPSKQSDSISVKNALVNLINEEGELHYLNVAHIDKPTDSEIGEVCKSIVSTFFQKTPANAGR